jgi:hypothetical protein
MARAVGADARVVEFVGRGAGPRPRRRRRPRVRSDARDDGPLRDAQRHADADRGGRQADCARSRPTPSSRSTRSPRSAARRSTPTRRGSTSACWGRRSASRSCRTSGSSRSARGLGAVERVDYAGYDALAPFRHALERHYFPYTHSWHAVGALHAACRALLDEGWPPPRPPLPASRKPGATRRASWA